MLKIVLLKLLLIGFSYTVFGQTGLKRWYFNGNEVDFSSGTPQVNPLPASRTNPKSLTHGMYGINGKPLFQVIDGNVYNKLGNLVGSVFLNPPLNGPPYQHVRSADEYAYEMSIVPVPGSQCEKFYLFYFESIVSSTSSQGPLYLGHSLRYTQYDLSLNNGQGGFVPGNRDVFIVDYRFSSLPGLAVSKPDANGNMKLFVAGANTHLPGTQVYRIDITNAGVSAAQQIWTNNLGFSTCEVDLSPDGTKLAFANLRFDLNDGTHDVAVLNLGTNGTVLSHQLYNLPGTNEQRFTGIEFHPEGTNLYVGASGVGIYNLDLTTGNATVVNNSALYGNSHLELAYDPSNPSKIFVVSNTGSLDFIDISSNSVVLSNLVGINLIKNGQHSNLHRPQVYVLPDQIDNFNYDQFFQQNNPVCCENLSGFNIYNHEVTSNATWTPASNPFTNTGIIDISNEFRVPSGKTLILQNMTFKFASNAKVIIEPNARLVLENTEFTSSDCGIAWQGIQVWGNSLQHQYTVGGTRFQGLLEVKNGSIIRNANDAIQLWNPGNYTTSGGMVYASNSSFINNRRTVEFISYENFLHSNPAIKTNYMSGFVNCTFEINDQLSNQTPFGAFVTMWNVRGINFSGCRFQNYASQFVSNQTGHGLYSIDASYTVGDYCPGTTLPCNATPIRSEFKNLHIAIESLGAISNKTFSISNALFEGNQWGIINNQVNFCRIVNNDFLITSSAYQGPKTAILINTATG